MSSREIWIKLERRGLHCMENKNVSMVLVIFNLIVLALFSTSCAVSKELEIEFKDCELQRSTNVGEVGKLDLGENSLYFEFGRLVPMYALLSSETSVLLFFSNEKNQSLMVMVDRSDTRTIQDLGVYIGWMKQQRIRSNDAARFNSDSILGILSTDNVIYNGKQFKPFNFIDNKKNGNEVSHLVASLTGIDGGKGFAHLIFEPKVNCARVFSGKANDKEKLDVVEVKGLTMALDKFISDSIFDKKLFKNVGFRVQ